MKRIIYILSLALIVFAIASCKKSGSKPDKGIELNLSATELQQASADNDFSFNLFRSVSSGSTDGANLFMSPLSVSMALGMTTNGANGATLDSMRTTLGLGSFTQDQVNSYYNKLITELPELDPNTTLKIANSIWYRQNFSVLSSFTQAESSNYLAKIQALDFTDPSSLNTINNWVSDQTNGKIKQIVSQINSNDMMFLINAIYFKSIWANKFDPSATKQSYFVLPDNSEIQTNFMNGHIPCKFYRDADASITILELPYANDKYSMVFVMPAAGQSLASTISGLNSTAWNTWMSQLGGGTIDVSVPRFEFSYSTSLKDELTAMGMGLAFSDAADFSNISAGAQLHISDVNHKAYIAVDETGTEAAAATSVTIGTSAAPAFQITLNHPFIFVIREMKSGLILFAGTVNSPAQTGL